MLRGLLSIAGVLVMAASLLVMLPTIILPNTFLHQLVPVLAPLHEAIACDDGETIRYKSFDADGAYDAHFFCVSASGVERSVDAALREPGYISVGTFCLGGLLLLGPLIFALRQTFSGAYGAESQIALQTSVEQARRGIAELRASGKEMTARASSDDSAEDS